MKKKKKRGPVMNRLGKRLKNFINSHIVDIPDEKKAAFREGAERLLVEALEHGMEGAARGAVSEAKRK